MKKVRFAIVLSLSIILFTLVGGYMFLAYYYRNSFSYGTFINNIYCTGKTIEEVNTELLSSLGDYEGLTIHTRDGKSYTVYSEDVNLKYDFKDKLISFYYGQNPLLWGENLIKENKSIDMMPDINYSSTLFDTIIDSFDFWEEDIPASERKVYIEKKDKGYILVDEKYDFLDREIAEAKIKESFENLSPVLDLEESACYSSIPYDEKDKSILEEFDKIDEFQNCKIVYRLGDELIPIDSSVACDFITWGDDEFPVLGPDGKIVPDTDKLNGFIDELAQNYDTYGKTHSFRTTDGRIVNVEGGNYGNEIDKEAENEYLLNAFNERKDEIHDVILSKEARALGQDDIGNTYIEIDMGKQHLYYYKDGVLTVDSDIVSGGISSGHGTPEGVYYVYNKAPNATLRGEDYVSHVKYWMAVYKGIGIHDASWRHGKFGGEIYKTNGSHGCVNTRLEEMKKLYELAEVGTPVIMFYG